jgi:putative ABC transport system permease protein
LLSETGGGKRTALGFSDRLVLVLVLVESCVVAGLGGFLGLAIAYALISTGDPTGGALPGFFLPTRSFAIGVALVVLLGVVAGIFPAFRAMRLRIVDALRRS